MELFLAFIAGAALAAIVVVLVRERTGGRPAAVLESALSELRASLDQLSRDQSARSGELRGVLDGLLRTQGQMAHQTSRLAEALRRPGVRGRWGELTLQNVLEAAGLASHIDFNPQLHLCGNGDDPGIRPDVVIRLPGEGIVPVDAKVPLDAFLDALDAQTPEERELALARHAQAVRGKVRELAAKAYWERFRRSPELVVMFVASEAAFSAAVQTDPTLLEEAGRSKVAIATPATMLALLQVVALGWRERDLSANADRVRGLAIELVKRIGILTGHLSDVGRSLERAVRAHNQAVGSYESRLLVTARQLGELGVVGAGELAEPHRVDGAPRQPALQAQGERD